MNKETALYKENCLGLAKHHKKNCNRKDCYVSLLLLMQMAEKTGVNFTKKEIEEFV